MTPTAEKMWLKRQTPKQCRKSYLVADESKFEKQAMTRINHLGNFTAVVTDKKFSAQEMKKLEKLHAKIIEV